MTPEEKTKGPNSTWVLRKRHYAYLFRVHDDDDDIFFVCTSYRQHHQKKTGAIENCKFKFKNNFTSF